MYIYIAFQKAHIRKAVGYQLVARCVFPIIALAVFMLGNLPARAKEMSVASAGSPASADPCNYNTYPYQCSLVDVYPRLTYFMIEFGFGYNPTTCDVIEPTFPVVAPPPQHGKTIIQSLTVTVPPGYPCAGAKGTAYEISYVWTDIPSVAERDTLTIDGAFVWSITLGPHPVNFRQVSVSSDKDGNLHFTYEWRSSSGHIADLSNCVIGELVEYPKNRTRDNNYY